jgi:hypothetical protein
MSTWSSSRNIEARFLTNTPSRAARNCASLAFWDAYGQADPAAEFYLQSDALPE